MADPTRYPSPSMMNMAEAGRSELQFREYVGALLEQGGHRPVPQHGPCSSGSPAGVGERDLFG
jgi:hypothetical protein